MPDDMELSPETKRLIEELGRRIAEEDSHLGDARRHRNPNARMAAQVPPAADELAAIDQDLEAMEKVRDVEAEIQHETDEDRLRYLRELRQFMMRDLKPSAQRRARLQRRREPDGMPDYLRPAISSVLRDKPASIWLYGNNARERRRAVDTMSSFIRMELPDWAVVDVDFHQAARRTSAPQPELEIAIRQAWNGWGHSDEPEVLYARSRVISHAGRNPRERWRRGVVVILSEFPARRRKAAEFLSWVWGRLSANLIPVHLIISTERPPARTVQIDVQSIECTSLSARIGRRIAELRRAKGWTRAQLAERARMSVDRLALIENGLEGIMNEPGHREFEHLANALGAHPGTFLA